MPVSRALATLASTWLAGAAAAEPTTYGSFVFHPDLPGTLFLTGQIATGDSFELRRAMREQEIVLVVAASPGGNLYEGLQIAPILHDNGIGTFVPDGASCESSCANVFLGGLKRLAVGNLGVHQFFVDDEDVGPVSAGSAMSATQYTTADIIGIMNGFDTPPFVYEKMFGTKDIHYFTASEKPRLNRNVDDEEFLLQIAAAEAFIAENPTAIQQRASQFPSDSFVAKEASPTLGEPETHSIKRMNDVDFFGRDLTSQGHRYVSLDACEALCQSDPDCAAWSYVTKTQWCWTKSGVENISYAPGTVSGVVNPSAVNIEVFERPFMEVTGQDVVGFDMVPNGIRNTTLSECRDACRNSSSCRAFTWVAKKNICFPKYGASHLREQLGVVSGVKNDG